MILLRILLLLSSLSIHCTCFSFLRISKWWRICRKICISRMTIIVRALWLAITRHHPRTSPSCTDRVFLVRCPRHVQSVFNLIVDILMAILVMINWQLSKGYPLTSVTWLYRGLKCTINACDVFSKVIRWPDVAFNWSQVQVYDEKAIKKDLLTSSVRSSRGNLRPRLWCIDGEIARSIHH